MNAAVTTRLEIEYLKQISSGTLSKTEPVSAEEWHNLYERMYDADLPCKKCAHTIPESFSGDQPFETDPERYHSAWHYRYGSGVSH
jgi:hypothetical protein